MQTSKPENICVYLLGVVLLRITMHTTDCILWHFYSVVKGMLLWVYLVNREKIILGVVQWLIVVRILSK